jgi:hypothetical protein
MAEILNVNPEDFSYSFFYRPDGAPVMTPAFKGAVRTVL